MKQILKNILLLIIMLLPIIGGICIIKYNENSIGKNHYKYEKQISHNNNEIKKHKTIIAVFYSDSHIDTLTFDTKSKITVNFNKGGVWLTTSSFREPLFETNAPVKVLKNE